MSTGKHRLAPKHAQHLINVHVGEIQYVYVHVTENTEGRAGEREIQYRGVRRCFWMEGLTVWMYHAYVKANRQTCREDQNIHTVLCVLLSAVYGYRSTHMYMFIYVHTYVHVLCHKIKLGDFQWQAAIRG